jgi:hypothetical protein
MFTLEYVTVTRVRGTNRVLLQIPSHLLAALRWCGWWVPTYRLDLQAGSEDSKGQRHRFEKRGYRTRLLLSLFQRGQGLVVVQGHNQALPFGQLIDCRRYALPKSGVQKLNQDIFV